MNKTSKTILSLCAGAFITACGKESPTTPVSVLPPEALAEQQACHAAFDKTLYAVDPSDKSPEAAAARKAIRNTPEEGRMLLDGCRSEWQRTLAANDQGDRTFACSNTRDILIRVGQIEESGVQPNETSVLRAQAAETYTIKCSGVSLPRR